MVLAGAMAASLTGCGGGANTSTTAVPTNAASEKGGETQIQPTEAKKEESGEKTVITVWTLVFTMSNEKMRPLTVGVTMLKNSGDGTAAWNLMFAGATISIVPIVVIYIFTSKHFMSGMTAGAVKG